MLFIFVLLPRRISKWQNWLKNMEARPTWFGPSLFHARSNSCQNYSSNTPNAGKRACGWQLKRPSYPPGVCSHAAPHNLRWTCTQAAPFTNLRPTTSSSTSFQYHWDRPGAMGFFLPSAGPRCHLPSDELLMFQQEVKVLGNYQGKYSALQHNPVNMKL